MPSVSNDSCSKAGCMTTAVGTDLPELAAALVTTQRTSGQTFQTTTQYSLTLMAATSCQL